MHPHVCTLLTMHTIRQFAIVVTATALIVTSWASGGSLHYRHFVAQFGLYAVLNDVHIRCLYSGQYRHVDAGPLFTPNDLDLCLCCQ